MQTASWTIVLADSSKFDQAGPVKICPVGDVHMVITDSGADKSVASRIQAAGSKVVILP